MNHKRIRTFSTQYRKILYLWVAVSLLLSLVGSTLVLPAHRVQAQSGSVTLDGDVHSNTADDVSTIDVGHATGTGTDRLMLVGVSWNCGTSARSISSVTFTYGTTEVPLTEVWTEQTGSQYRYAAIYSLVNPPSGEAGTVTVTFSGAVSNGIIAGAANFAGVDQTTPLGPSNGANGNSTAPSVDLAGLDGDELVFDTVFQGASNESQTLTAGSGQTEQWNAWIANARAAASTEEATSSSVTMSWTADSSSYWAVAAVAINPGAAGPTQDLTVAVSPGGGGTTDPAEGVHTYPQNEVVDVTATPNLGYVFDRWEGDCTGTDPDVCQVTMDVNRSVTAVFVAQNYDLTMAVDPAGGGTTTPAEGGPHSYPAGTVMDISATANEGYLFDSWTGDVADPNSANTTVTMDGDKAVTANFVELTGVVLDGAVSSGTAGGVSSVNVAHTTGTGADRLMLVGVSANSYNNARTISSVTFTPDGGSATALAEVGSIENEAGRLAAIYGLIDPPSGASGTVAVTFSDSVAYGIVVGVANFAGVDQTTPLGTFASATGQSTDPSVDLTGLGGDELVFDTVFVGAASIPAMTVGADQTQHWNTSVDRAGGVGSTEQATGSSVTMSWTAGDSVYWSIGAVPIKPVGEDTTSPTVTIEQASAQADPTSASPINFEVVFSEPVADFSTGDVTLGGSAGADTAEVTEIAPNDGTTYNVAVSGMTGPGTVIVTVDAGVAHDAADNPNEASTSVDNEVTYEYSAPTISITGTPLSAFSSEPGVPSAEQSYTVSGSNLTADIEITAPADFEISTTSGSGFGSSLTLPQSGGSVAATTIHVRFNRATEGTSNGDITHTSTGATTQNVAVSGEAASASTTVIFQEGLDGYAGTRDTYIYDVDPDTARGSEETIVQDKNTSDERRSLLLFDLSSIPVGSTIVSAEIQFYVSAEGQGFDMHRMLVPWDEATVTFNSIGGRHFQADDVDAESAVDASWPGDDGYTGLISVSVPPSTIQDWVDGTLTNNGWLMIATHSDDGQQLRSREYGTPDDRPKLTVEYYSSTDPTITVSGTPLDAFSSEPGTPSAEQSYTVSGSNLTADIEITAPADFEISTTSGSGFGPSLTLPQSGGSVAVTTIHVRFDRATEGISSGDITHTSTGATTRNVAVSGTASYVATVTFQEGVDSYSGTVDTFIMEDDGSAVNGNAETVEWDADDPYGTGHSNFGLLRFEGIFGSGAGQIPLGAAIESATLTYVVNNEGDAGDVNEVTIDWTEDVTYDEFGDDAGVQPEEYGVSVGTSNGGTGVQTMDVTASVAAWASDPTANHGWIFRPTGDDGVEFRSSEYSTSSERPMLEVTYSTGGPANQPPDQPALVQPTDDATGVSIPPTLEATVSDPDEDTLDVTFYGRPVGTGGGEEFVLIAIPDTQNEAQYYPDTMYGQFQWIADEQDAENIVFATGLGDIVNVATSEAQWIVADTAFDYLDAGGGPYSVGPGNHDVGTSSLYETYFGVSRFDVMPWYAGHYGSDNYNNYSLFSASGMDFILINLQYSPTTDQINWADARLQEYPERLGIVVQHDILNINNSWTNQTSYNTLRSNPNLFLMLCGHMHNSGDGSAYLAGTGTDSHTIHVLLTDYQDYPNGGDGYLRLLTFKPADDEILAQVYSPTLDDYLTNASNYEEFTMAFDMAGGSAFELIGTATGVTSGDDASIAWPDLDPDTEYEWYVEVSDGSKATTGPTWSFTTAGSETGTIIVEKQTDPDGWTDPDFEFTGDATGFIGDGGQIVVNDLVPGEYHVQEVVPAGWILSDVLCDDGNSEGDLPNFEADIQLEAGETVKCTFYNLLELDYGDAPDSYSTLLASNGARHVIVVGHSLGSVVEAEPDGQPSSLADGDDLNPAGGPDDEDGVVLPAVLTAGDPAAAITVDGGPSGGMLDAWVDWDGSGVFEHPAEHLWGGTSQMLSSGSNLLTFAVPASAVPGQTYARFRLSNAGGLPPDGLAPDGEVEDYLVEIGSQTFTLNYAAGPGGSLTGDTSQVVAYGQDGTSVTAVPDTGYGFVDWSDGSTANPRTDTNVTANVDVTANFARILGDVDRNGSVTSTDALIVLSCDAGLDTSGYCPMNCGDVNADGLINSTDALVILTYDADLPVGYPVGEPGCPATVTPCPGCSP